MPDAPWIATYRLQLHAGFPLHEAAKILPYLAGLGISHVYLSPCLQANPGSPHGYDLADPTKISDDLGGDEGWKIFQEQARAQGLRVLLDIVPNHMAASVANPWWADVLAHGPYSQHTEFFDLRPFALGDDRWRLHLATLGQTYDAVLAAGELSVEPGAHGRPVLKYFDNTWPLAPVSWRELFGNAVAAEPAFGKLEKFADISRPDDAAREDYDRCWRAAQKFLQEKTDGKWGPPLAGLSREPARLHALLQRQWFALHHWQREGEVTNYRRFFDIGSLVALRADSPVVFGASHSRVAAMISAGEIDGLRVDHPDGLSDPLAYLERLRALLPQGRIYVEKILDNSEQLREGWPVDGTVGYDFLSKVNRLWMADEKKDALTAAYADFTGHPVNFPALVREKKLQIIESSFPADLERLADRGWRLAQSSWQTCDLSRRQLRVALKTLIAALPVYRTYRREGLVHPDDRAMIVEALAGARLYATGVEPAVFAFLESVLLHDNPNAAEMAFIMRWQQLTPAVMAKGVEDTTFYCYDRLVSCNEVGAQASLLGIPAEKFHEFCHQLGQRWPRNLLATSTHDNKRSEDVRTRISVLSEIPDRWREALHEWSRLNTPAWRGRASDRHAEYLLYQTLVGAWPLERERCWNYMLKACREAKILTSWRAPNAAYEESLRDFIDGVYASAEFMDSLQRFVAPLVRHGRVNSLAQTLIKMTAPGLPDFYQGTELWDLSLVDPDNRRPVDFAIRAGQFARARSLPVPDGFGDAEWEGGLPKIWMMARTLAIRRKRERSFATGSYTPLTARGSRLGHLLGYLRDGDVAVIVPRFTFTLGGDWGDTLISLPPGRWANEFTGAQFEGDVGPAECFGTFPVALLTRQG